jgi:predicted dithiol-disulfide oxidoreductase (DUF899 family)
MRATMMTHAIVSRDEWQAARAPLLEREKTHTRLGDELARQRRALPWVRIDKEYTYAANGRRTANSCSCLLPHALEQLSN